MRNTSFLAKIFSVFLVVFTFAIPTNAEPVNGQPAPNFTGLTAEGEHINLSDFQGKPVVLEWTNHQCPYVRKHYNSGNMQKTQRALTEDGTIWISIISSAPGEQGHVTASEAQHLTVSRGSYANYVVLDPEGLIGRKYSAKTTPHMFLINENGILVYQGAIDDIPSASQRTLKDAKNLVLAAWSDFQTGKTIEIAQTKPYGCSVKYSSTDN